WPSSFSCARTVRTSTASRPMYWLYPGAAQLDKVRRSQRDRVPAGEAGRAVPDTAALGPDRRHHALVREVRDRIARDVATDLLGGMRGGDQLAAGRRVDPVEARMGGRRCADPQMNLARARIAQHLDDLARRGAAHQRVIDHDHALAVDDRAHDGELE